MRAERLRESSLSGDHRMGVVASGASDSRARAGGPTFVEHLDRAEAEDASNENADEYTNDAARSIEHVISPAKENVPPNESGERDAQTAACQVPVTTAQHKARVPSTAVTPTCTPRRSARASKPSVRLQRV